MNSIYDFNFIADGEIVGVVDQTDDPTGSVRYLVRVFMRNGNSIVMSDVEEMTQYGGIADYSRRRASVELDLDSVSSVNPDDLDANIGERVYISFINGNIKRPFILGYRQHPNQVTEPDLINEDGDEKTLRSVTQYLGVRREYDKSGRFRFIRKGAPELAHVPAGEDGEVNEDAFAGDDNPALTPKDGTERIVMEFLDKALYRVRDPLGGIIELDHDGPKKGVFFSNNDWKSTEDADNLEEPESGGLKEADGETDAEFIWLNRDKKELTISARNKVKIYSGKDREDVTVGNFIEKITGNKDSAIEGDSLNKITGLFSVEASSGAKLVLDGGKVALGANGTEVLEQVINVFKSIVQEAAKFTATSVGPGALSPGVIKAVTEAQVKLESIKGSL